MFESKTRLIDRVLAMTLVVVMLLAMVPASAVTAFAKTVAPGDDCQEATCDGKLQWIAGDDGSHYLVCDNAECAFSAIEKAELAHPEGEEVDCPICNPPHVHGNFAYSVENENRTLVATCGSEGNCDLKDKKVSITLAAPAKMEYDGDVKAATIKGAAEWEKATGAKVPEIKYSAEPRKAGTYTASITVEGKTASVEFSIEKATPEYTVPTDLKAVYGQTLADIKLPVGFAWEDKTQAVGEIGVNRAAAIFTPADKDNYNVVEKIFIKYTVEKISAGIAAPALDLNTETSITLQEIIPDDVDAIVEYGYIAEEADKDDPSKVNNWQTGTTFENLEGSTTYYFYARVSETDHYSAAISPVATISTKEKKNGDVTITISGWTYGETAATPDCQIIDGDYQSAKIEYVAKGGSEWSETAPTAAGEYTVRVTYAATPVYALATATCDFTIAKKEVTLKWENTILTYNAAEQVPTAIVEGAIEGDTVTATVSKAKINAGNYDVEAVLEGNAAGNYVIKDGYATSAFSILTKEVVVEWSNTELTHRQEAQAPTANTDDLVEGDSVMIAVSGEQKKPGTHTATASLSGENAKNYYISEDSQTSEFTISCIDVPENDYTIVKEDGTPAEANENGWYNYNVVIKPAEGYTIGIADDSDEDFVPNLPIDASKENYTVYLRDSDGYYSAAIEIGDIHIDKENPAISIAINGVEPWEIWLETISFEIFRNEEITVTISGNDGNSDVYGIYYYKVEGNRLTNADLFTAETIRSADIAWVQGSEVTVNSDNDYVVYGKIVDNAGNASYISTQGFVYDTTPPAIEVSFDNNSAQNEKYFKADRTATIKITEHNFDESRVKLTVTENGVDTSENYRLPWAIDQSNPDLYTATVSFTNEADYTFAVSCKDKVGNDNDPVVYTQESKATNAFTIDKSRPNVSLVISGQVYDADRAWAKSWFTEDGDEATSKVLNSVSYDGRWTQSDARVVGHATDNLSQIDYIEYFRTDSIPANIIEFNWNDTEKVTKVSADNFEFFVQPNEKFIVYAHVVDKAGNDIYLSSDGVIVDDKAPGGAFTGDQYSPEIDIAIPEANEEGFFNGDVVISFNVAEPKYSGAAQDKDNGVFSGIREIKYVIKAEDIGAELFGEIDLESNAFDKTYDNTTGLLESCSGTITISSEQFNSNNVVLEITAIDNAGNPHTTVTQPGQIQIDIIAPDIYIEYDNNDFDSGFYYKAARTATIIVKERNFDPADFIVSITASPDGMIPTLSDWSDPVGTGDETTRQATITFYTDGDYTFNVEFTDLAGWTCGNVAEVAYDGELTYGEGSEVNATAFTIDTIDPIVTVSYDNNSAQNGKYFDADRVATVTITEHNFPKDAEGNVDYERIVFAITPSRGGKDPAITWETSKDPDTYVAKIAYKADGDYAFSVDVTDLAGNECEDAQADYGKSKAPKDFVVDTTYEDMISQQGVENGTAYGHDAEVIPSIKIHDINLDEYTVTLTGVQKDQTIDLTDEVNALLDEGSQTVTGILDVFKTEQALDGIYTLKMYSKDLAGNEDNMEIVFTVNRFGSVYVFEDYLLNLVKDGGAFVQKVDSDLIMTEYNADKLLAGSLKIEITVDGKPLENVRYTVAPEINDTVEVGSSGWYQYKYTISKDNFAEDGVYKISVSSADATGNTPENSNYEDKGMLFRVDSTRSEISSVVGLEKAIINAQEVVVKYTVFDTIGIKSIIVYVDDSPVDEIADLSADPNNYSGSFTLKESNTAQKVRIVIEDKAGNITDTNAGDFAPAYDFNGSVTVSTNIFVRWYANKPLFWGSIGGIIVLAGGLYFFLANKKKKAAK